MKLKSDEPLFQNFAFNFNLRPYDEGVSGSPITIKEGLTIEYLDIRAVAFKPMAGSGGKWEFEGQIAGLISAGDASALGMPPSRVNRILVHDDRLAVQPAVPAMGTHWAVQPLAAHAEHTVGPDNQFLPRQGCHLHKKRGSKARLTRLMTWKKLFCQALAHGATRRLEPGRRQG